MAPDPDPPTLSRRGALAVVGGGALLVAALTAGQTLGGFTRAAALLLPRGRSYGKGPNDFKSTAPPLRPRIDPAVTGDRVAPAAAGRLPSGAVGSGRA